MEPGPSDSWNSAPPPPPCSPPGFITGLSPPLPRAPLHPQGHPSHLPATPHDRQEPIQIPPTAWSPGGTHQLPVLEPHDLRGWEAICVTLQRQGLPGHARHVGPASILADAGGHWGQQEAEEFPHPESPSGQPEQAAPGLGGPGCAQALRPSLTLSSPDAGCPVHPVLHSTCLCGHCEGPESEPLQAGPGFVSVTNFPASRRGASWGRGWPCAGRGLPSLCTRHHGWGWGALGS